jgi:hypothetical protein
MGGLEAQNGAPELEVRQTSGVADPHHFNADQDPAFHLNADPDLARIWLLIKGMRICDHWSAEPPAAGLHFEPPCLQCEHSRFLASKASIFNFNADPNSASHSYVDPAPAAKNNADPDPQP